MSDWLGRDRYEDSAYAVAPKFEKDPLFVFGCAAETIPSAEKARAISTALGEMHGDIGNKIYRGDKFDRRDAYHAMSKVAELWAFQTGRLP